VVKKFKIKARSNEIKLIFIDKTIKNEEAEKLWSDMLLKEKQFLLPDIVHNFQNINIREIILTERGIYLESKFF
jgi:hypothetical protein